MVLDFRENQGSRRWQPAEPFHEDHTAEGSPSLKDDYSNRPSQLPAALSQTECILFPVQYAELGSVCDG